MQDVVEFISLTLTVPTLALSFWVLFVFGPQSLKTFFGIFRGMQSTPPELLVMGISVGFLGAFLDNAYWGLAWSADFFKLETRDVLFDFGAWANIPFRQAAGIAAATLHLSKHISAEPFRREVYWGIWGFTLLCGLTLGLERWMR